MIDEQTTIYYYIGGQYSHTKGTICIHIKYMYLNISQFFALGNIGIITLKLLTTITESRQNRESQQ